MTHNITALEHKALKAIVDISEVATSKGNIYMTVKSGKQEVIICQHSYGVRVHVQNAMARVYRYGCGRIFKTWTEARAAFKSATVQAAIDEAQATAAVYELMNA